MRLYLTGTALIIAAATLTLGVDRLRGGELAPATLEPRDAVLLTTGGWLVLLGAATTPGRPGLAAVLEVMAGVIT